MTKRKNATILNRSMDCFGIKGTRSIETLVSSVVRSLVKDDRAVLNIDLRWDHDGDCSLIEVTRPQTDAEYLISLEREKAAIDREIAELESIKALAEEGPKLDPLSEGGTR